MQNGDQKHHAEDVAKAAQEKMKRTFDDLTAKSMELFSEGIENARHLFEQQTEVLKHKAEEFGLDEVPAEVKSYIRRKPFQSIAIAAGVGLAIGLLLRSGRSSEPRE